MSYCAFCGSELSPDVRFCSACGKPVVNTDDVATLDFATAASPLPARPASGASSKSSSRASSRSSTFPEYAISEGRFLPGRLIAGRYRIIALLGKGGMGEVYRADDLTLGQAVALKFLPDAAASDEALLERFRNEVRIARRVSHPNVCRVYDVGEVDGQTFFTMEYVDGEDLASLLRRIGRLPQDKAVEISRQLCAGLAAAHAKGVLHRDLKPANIMLDGRGQVVITDFGLAGVADDIRGPEVRSGTPAYMAPEQISGKEVTMRSDIYALGLVLYEIFTGKRAFADKVAGALRGNGDRSPSRPSSVVKDLDPVIEKVILRCLEEDPGARPVTALAVAALLPGGDPLAAALAAGETPSPQLVAASGETVGFRPRIALACMAAVVIGLLCGVFFITRYNAVEKIDPQQPPDVLSAKARDIVERLGYKEKPADTASGFDFDSDYLDFVEKQKQRVDWNQVLTSRPDPLLFWYRQSPETMITSDYQDFLMIPDIVREEHPATTLSGMINVKLDSNGRLIYFQAIPPQKDSAPAATAAPDWNPLFAAADLDASKLQAATPEWNSLGAADARAAWTGFWPGTTRPLRVEAAAWHGKPVFFATIGEWNKPWRMVAPKSADDWKAHFAQAAGVSLLIVLLVSGALLARRNFRHGRGDRQGAMRLGIFLLVLEVLLAICKSHFVGGFEIFAILMLAIASGLLWGAVMWMLYMAVEPWIRKRWPHALISWNRILSGQFRDAVVGRDILIGVGFAVLWMLLFETSIFYLTRSGASPQVGSMAYLMGGRIALGQWLMQLPFSVLGTLEFFFLLLGLKVVLRKDWIAAIAFVAIFVAMRGLQSSHPAVEVPLYAVIYGLVALLVFRFGLVPLAVAAFTVDMLGNVPFTADTSQWYMGTTLLTLLSVLAIAGWGFYHSLGGQPLWKADLD